MAESGVKLSSEQIDSIIRLTVAGKSQSEISEELGVSRSTVSRYQTSSGKHSVFKDKLNKKDSPKINNDGVVSFKSKGDEASGEYVTNQLPTEQTLEGILRECGADLTTWVVKEWSYKAWSTGMNAYKDGENQIVYAKQYSIHVQFKRILPESLKKASDAIFERMAKHAPVYSVPKYKRPKGGMLAGAFIFDHHMGKLSWHRETGEDYDLKIATARFNNAVDDMVGHIALQGVDRILFPIGQDYLHFDSRNNTTANGTVQDVDGRLEKVVEAAELSAIRAVELMSNVAPVDVVWVGGNHDFTLSYMLARTVAAWFRRHKGVTVDCEPKSRKYFRWRSVLLGMCHSDREKVGDLALLMATERPDDWAETVCREFIVAHRHHPEKWQTKPIDSKCGVAVRTIRTLTGSDAWHTRAGYVGEPKAAELHYYSDLGHDSYKLIHARDDK